MESLIQAFASIFEPNSELLQIIGVTLRMALFSTTISALIGIPLGVYIGMHDFHGKRVLMRILNTLMSMPPVLAGLIVFLLLSRSGPFGSLRLLFSVTAMVIAQVVLITPIVIGLASTAITILAPKIHETSVGINLSHSKELLYLLYEARTQLFSILFVAFGRSIGEVGAVMLVGGNVQFKTRVMTTAIMLETNMGDFSFAIALGIILLLISFVINSLALSFEEHSHKHSMPRRLKSRKGV